MSHRDDLLEAAIRCLYKKGYARTTARDLVAESHTNLGSIGYHFGSKERLMDEALLEAFHRWVDPVIDFYTGPGPEPLLERLQRGAADFMDSLERNRPLVVACFEAIAQVERSRELRRDLAKTYERWRTTIAEALERLAAERGADLAGAGRASASVVMALSDGFMLQWLLDPKAVPDMETVLGDMMRVLPFAFAELQRAAGAR